MPKLVKCASNVFNRAELGKRWGTKTAGYLCRCRRFNAQRDVDEMLSHGWDYDLRGVHDEEEELPSTTFKLIAPRFDSEPIRSESSTEPKPFPFVMILRVPFCHSRRRRGSLVVAVIFRVFIVIAFSLQSHKSHSAPFGSSECWRKRVPGAPCCHPFCWFCAQLNKVYRTQVRISVVQSLGWRGKYGWKHS